MLRNEGERIRPSERTAVALDAVRGAAACYVVLHHLAYWRGWTAGAGVVFRFGQEAVIVFFILSGFVIHANEKTRAIRSRGYLLRRIRRIYPPLICAMAVSSLVAIDNGDFARLFGWRAFWGTLLSVQDISMLKPGVITDPYLGNDPLWSLSYEVAFYLAYPLILAGWRARPRLASAIIGAICCVAYGVFVVYPNHFLLVAAYFQIWWCGAMAAEAYGQGGRTARALAGPLGWLLVLTAIAAAAVVVVGYRGPGLYPFLPFRHVACALALFIVFFGPVGAAVASACRPLARPAAAVASISYGLYVLHFPLLIQWHRSGGANGLAVAGAILVGLAWAADAKLNRLLPRVSSG